MTPQDMSGNCSMPVIGKHKGKHTVKGKYKKPQAKV